MKTRLISWLVRFWRVSVLAGAAFLLQHASHPPAGAEPFSLADARSFFPLTETLTRNPDGVFAAKDSTGETLGLLLTTSPASDDITGYAGPSNLMVALHNNGKIAGSKILQSADTPAHVETLANQPAFASSLLGWNPSNSPPPTIDGIGGSTLTGLAMVEGISARLGGSASSMRFPKPLSLDEVRSFFPSAATFDSNQPRNGWSRVISPTGSVAGFVVRTSPVSDGIIGYAGPTECLVSVAPDQRRLLQVRIRSSYDSEDYVSRIVEDEAYLKSLTKWEVPDWPSLDFKSQEIEGVAGATMTSSAIAVGLKERFKFDSRPVATKRYLPSLKDVALWFVVALGSVVTFTSLRGLKWVRLLWQFSLIFFLGLWLGQFLSLALLAGWAKNGIPWAQAAPLVTLALAAVAVPATTGRHLYCHHVCPHGAAQEVLGRFTTRKIILPNWLHRVLGFLPAALLVLAFASALYLPRLALANFEPFDFWVLGKAAAIPAVLAIVGLSVSAVIPMAYCRYGCPTGALLSFLRSSSHKETFKARDCIAALMLLGVALNLFTKNSPQTKADASALRGTAFGTTWCVKLRQTSAPPKGLHEQVATEIERIESTLSHWQPTSSTSIFNSTKSTDPQPAPQELVALVQFAQRLSLASHGAYDITIAPITNLWGYGPAGPTSVEPSDVQIHELLERVGWNKLVVGKDGASLQKLHAELSIDLGSILQGYAVDRLCSLLDTKGYSDYLVEVGGELRARGSWTVAIENPADPRRPLKVIQLKDAALATSGLARARKQIAGRPVSHILSPRTGRPIEPTIEMCSVSLPSCLEADGWATALLASGVESTAELIPSEAVESWVLDVKGVFKQLR